MPEYIERNNLIDYLTKATGHKATCDGCCDIDCVDCIRDEVIKNLPTADVVDVVRCKDCKFFINRNGINWCEEHSDDQGDYTVYMNEDDFCSYGRRKEGANNG